MDEIVRTRSYSVSDTYDIYAIGEYIRSEMHLNSLIRDRKYHFRTYKTCFQGNETVDWLIRCHHCDQRSLAIKAMRMLEDRGFLHHVCDDHKFKDEALFYRYRMDDENTMEEYNDLKNFYTGQKYYRIVVSSKRSILRSYQLRGQVYHKVFVGSAFVDLLLLDGEVALEEEAIKIGRNLLEMNIIKHITDDHHFRNSMLLYQFIVNYDGKHSLSDILKYNIDMGGRDSAFSRSYRDHPNTHHSVYRLHDRGIPTNYDNWNDENKDVQPPDASGSFGDSSLKVEIKPKSVLLRCATPDELEDPDTPYVKTSHKIYNDSMGYGFVVRGEGPTHIQTIDPCGPAATAGLKIRQYVYSVNGENVLRKDHRSIAKLIANCPLCITVCVMTHKRDAG